VFDDEDEDEDEDEVEVVDEIVQLILVKTYLLTPPQITKAPQNPILITPIVLILIKYVRSNVIMVILEMRKTTNVTKYKLLHEI